ncbi:MAG: hypothetical protein WBM86_05500 [Waterburya sp.]
MFTSTKSKKQPPASKAIAHNLQKKSPGNYSLKNLSIQTNLTIGNPNDKYEQEADRVMTMPEPILQKQSEKEEMQSPIDSSLQNVRSRLNVLIVLIQ